jgi:hypothetical protein
MSTSARVGLATTGASAMGLLSPRQAVMVIMMA